MQIAQWKFCKILLTRVLGQAYLVELGCWEVAKGKPTYEKMQVKRYEMSCSWGGNHPILPHHVCLKIDIFPPLCWWLVLHLEHLFLPTFRRPRMGWRMHQKLHTFLFRQCSCEMFSKLLLWLWCRCKGRQNQSDRTVPCRSLGRYSWTFGWYKFYFCWIRNSHCVWSYGCIINKQLTVVFFPCI